MTAKIFIDGEYGTTGLQIRERLAKHDNIELLSVPSDQRRDQSHRTEMLHEADIAILCLPDDAARQSVKLADNSKTRILDASSAHRSLDEWVYGFAEIAADQDRRIAGAQYVSNPGCYPTGAIALINPLIMAGLMQPDYPLTINAVSGYSGGGKALIAKMENPSADEAISSMFFSYSLNLKHKHVPEIIKRCGLTRRPIFAPNVGRFAQGMLVQIPLFLAELAKNTDRQAVHTALTSHYEGQKYVKVMPLDQSDAISRLDPEEHVGRDDMTLYVLGDSDGGEINLIASLDNLGKGASGAAVQNLELMLAG